MASGQLGLVLHQLRRMLGGPAADATDRQLLEHYAATRDEPAFTQLVRRHGPMVQGVCRRVLGRDPEADDAFQATFLVLAKKADSVFWQESIGNWLYGVAYRTASKVRARNARRRQREQEAAGKRDAVQAENGDAHELQQVLDEELIRLPEKFRMPVLLCCLQDQTIDEAAQQLGWSCTTIKGRLQRGREMLRNRLQRRGIGLSAGVLATILTQGVVSATSPTLLKTTVQAVVTGTLPDSVTALAQGVMQAMFWTKLKTASLVLLAVAVLGGGAGTVFYHGSTTTAAPLPEEVKKQPPAKTTSTVTQNGLEVVVTLTKATFAADEQPTLEVTYTNRTEKALRLYDVGYEISHFSVLDLGTNGPWQAGPWAYSARPAPRSVELAAGKAHVQAHTVRGPFTWKGEQSAPVPPRNTLTPGKYRLTGKIVFSGVRTSPTPQWTGEIATEPVEFEIARQPLEAALKDGLSLTIAPAKAPFATGEMPTFDLVFKNVGENAFWLHGLGWQRGWDVRIHEAGWTEGYWVPVHQKAAERPNPAADIANLKPQAERRERLALDGVKYDWRGPQDRPRGPLDRLSAGKYQVEVRIDFGPVPGGALPGGNRDRHWVGQLVSKLTEFEVKAEQAVAPLSVKDANSGITVTVTDDAKALTATDAAGKVIWKLNLIAAVKDFLGTPAIGSVSINDQGQVEARFGKSNLARIDLKTGKLLEHLAR